MKNFKFSRDELLRLQNKPCVCLSRTVRRRLVYYKLYNRHISTRITYSSGNSHLRPTRERRCLQVVPCQPRSMTRAGRRVPALPSLLLSNVRSLSNKMDESSLLVGRLQPSLVVFTETWLDSSFNDDAVGIDGYRILRRDREVGRGGGIICYIGENLNFRALSASDVPALGSVSSEILAFYVPEFHLLLICVYHAFWNCKEANESAISCFSEILDYGYIQFGSHVRIMLCGDFNDLRHHFCDISTLTCLKPIVNVPTRGSNCLDQIFSNFSVSQKPVIYAPLGMSDHCVIFWQPVISSRPYSVRKVKIRKISQSRKAKFQCMVAEYDWLALVQNCVDLNESSSIFLNCLFALFDYCFPCRTVRLRSNEPSWMRPSLKILIDDKDKAFHNKQWSRYFRLRLEIKEHMRHLKERFIQSAVTSADSRKVWKSLRCLGQSSNKSFSTHSFTPDDFNSFFASNFQESDLQLSPLPPSSNNTPELLSVFEILSYLRSLPNKSTGPDGIPPWVFRDCRLFLCPAIAFLFNRSIFESSVPLCLKRANVVPIPKSKNPVGLGDFRPISLLPVLSKLLEKIVSTKFILPLISHRVSSSQFAYISRPGSGPTCALVLAYHRILQFLDASSGAVRVLSVDFSKAFDKLLHSRIISACIDFNFPNHLINWIASFLTGRVQRVSLNGNFSSWCNVTSGIPQGSILGPILFCLATDNLSHVCSNSSIIKYADDISIFHFLRSNLDDNLQSEWNNIVSWSHSSSLPLNFSKCCVIDFVTKKDFSLTSVSLSDGTCLRSVSSLSFLGVIFSRDLKWTLHVDAIVKKASQRLFILRNLRRANCPLPLMSQCYFAFIRSVLLFAFPTFCNIPTYLFSKLRRVEKRACRIMGCDSNTFPPLSSAAEKVCTKLFNSVLYSEEHPLREMFVSGSDRSTRSKSIIRPPRSKTVRFKSSFIRFSK